MFRREENDTMIDNFMNVDNYLEEPIFDLSYRNNSFNLFDSNSIIQRFQMLFEKGQYLEVLNELPDFIKNRQDIIMKLMKYHLFDLISRDINLSKQFYWSKMFNYIRMKPHFETINKNFNQLLDNPSLVKTKIFELKFEESKKKFLNNLMKEVSNLMASSYFNSNQMDSHRFKTEFTDSHSKTQGYDSDFEMEVINTISNHNSSNNEKNIQKPSNIIFTSFNNNNKKYIKSRELIYQQ